MEASRLGPAGHRRSRGGRPRRWSAGLWPSWGTRLSPGRAQAMSREVRACVPPCRLRALGLGQDQDLCLLSAVDGGEGVSSPGQGEGGGHHLFGVQGTAVEDPDGGGKVLSCVGRATLEPDLVLLQHWQVQGDRLAWPSYGGHRTAL